ncbi:hypothetical protein [Candidatus Frankia nodulisporulans]|uniref:hypothetical protein n=1 Tax=Candidatus Frankia nodulisporulans TaxID=2060052 RepID=UPI0013D7A7B9|nr:hypothetical protein [Candidatus Frankia nodulisporulans]
MALGAEHDIPLDSVQAGLLARALREQLTGRAVWPEPDAAAGPVDEARTGTPVRGAGVQADQARTALLRVARAAPTLDELLDAARGHLAGLLLARITARVRRSYRDAAALRLDEDTVEPRLLAVLDADGWPVPGGSADPADEGTAAWSHYTIGRLDSAIGADLAWYVPLVDPVSHRMPLADRPVAS